MYATAHRVVGLTSGERIDASVQVHGPDYGWPKDADGAVAEVPGRVVWERHGDGPRGGNRVYSYLDILAPDLTPSETVDEALDTLWLHLVADEAGPTPGLLPNPLVLSQGSVVVRFGVALEGSPNRALEMAALRRALEPGVHAGLVGLPQ